MRHIYFLLSGILNLYLFLPLLNYNRTVSIQEAEFEKERKGDRIRKGLHAGLKFGTPLALYIGALPTRL